MRTVLTMFFLVQSFLPFAQNGQLKGHVSDLDDDGNFSGLSIYVMKDTTVIGGAVTDKNGNYTIENIPVGIYEIKLSFLGYRVKRISNYEILDGLKTENFVFPNPCLVVEKKCSYGHTDNIIPIVYGMPTPKTMKKAKKMKVYLGGCTVTNCDPKWYCKKHRIEF